jgi:hypothetical protein
MSIPIPEVEGNPSTTSRPAPTAASPGGSADASTSDSAAGAAATTITGVDTTKPRPSIPKSIEEVQATAPFGTNERVANTNRCGKCGHFEQCWGSKEQPIFQPKACITKPFVPTVIVHPLTEAVYRPTSSKIRINAPRTNEEKARAVAPTELKRAVPIPQTFKSRFEFLRSIPKRLAIVAAAGLVVGAVWSRYTTKKQNMLERDVRMEQLHVLASKRSKSDLKRDAILSSAGSATAAGPGPGPAAVEK